jgi:hypothetical protein
MDTRCTQPSTAYWTLANTSQRAEAVEEAFLPHFLVEVEEDALTAGEEEEEEEEGCLQGS